VDSKRRIFSMRRIFSGELVTLIGICYWWLCLASYDIDPTLENYWRGVTLLFTKPDFLRRSKDAL
jgi:hypothetical protein